MTDSIDDLMSDLYWLDSGWHRQVNPITGAVGLFPSVPRHPSGSAKARAAEDAWEIRALVMHENQAPIHLAPKPRENVLSRIERGN